MKKRSMLAMLMAALLVCVIGLAGCGGPSPEEVIREGLTSELEELKSGDNEDFIAGLEEGSDGAFDDLGISTSEFAESYLDGFDYSVGEITVDSENGTATAEVSLTAKSMTDVVSAWYDDYLDWAYSLTEEPSEEEYMTKAGELMMEALRNTEPTTTDIELPYELNDNTWEPGDGFEDALYEALM